MRDGKSDDDKPGLSLSTNGKPDGHLIGDYPTMALAALIPALLADEPKRSFVIGYGTGVTAGELAALDSMQEVHVAEISQAVLEAAPLFEVGNQAPLANPKVFLHRSDAYRSLLRAEGLYDVIVSEPSNPWVSGVEMLFSQEFLAAAKNKLTPGGVYAQWFHLYEIDNAAVQLILRTYLSVFDHVSIWFTMPSDLVIMGVQDPDRALDTRAIRARFNQPDFKAGFERVNITNLAALFAHEVVPLGVLQQGQFDGPIQTLRHPRLSHLAAKAFFKNSRGHLPPLFQPKNSDVARKNSLLRSLAQEGRIPQKILGIAASENCLLDRGTQCATLMARWMHDYPDSESFHRALALFLKNPSLTPHLKPEILERLSRHFDKKKIDFTTKRPLPLAQKETSLYLKHFSLVIPFERERLEGVWRACDTPPCEKARREKELLLGPLDTESKAFPRKSQ